MYKFSQIVGKLVNGSSSIGQGLKGSETGTKIIYGPHVKFTKVETTFVPPSKEGYGEMSPKMLQLQKHYQVADGVPIHLKGGRVDKILYYSTLAMCLIGLEECFRYYYSAAFPKKVE